MAVGDGGSVEITCSQFVHDKFEAIAEGLPTCHAKRRRHDVSAFTRRRTYQLAKEVAQDSEFMSQIEEGPIELTEAAGGEGYAAEILEVNESLTFEGADLL